MVVCLYMDVDVCDVHVCVCVSVRLCMWVHMCVSVCVGGCMGMSGVNKINKHTIPRISMQ